jgi:hypothetical protein
MTPRAEANEYNDVPDRRLDWTEYESENDDLVVKAGSGRAEWLPVESGLGRIRGVSLSKSCCCDSPR